MKKPIISFIIVLILFASVLFAQDIILEPDLSEICDPAIWTLHNREIVSDDVVHLNGQRGDGLLWINDAIFANMRIEVDIRGLDVQGRSFVGIAFHILNGDTYDAIYFRPFNFKNPERNSHSLQYISHPENTWSFLRENFPEKYENPVTPVPDPTGWFHATIIVSYPQVRVFVNNSIEPSLIVEQLSSRKQGRIGFWVGNGSEGWFKNLKIISRE